MQRIALLLGLTLVLAACGDKPAPQEVPKVEPPKTETVEQVKENVEVAAEKVEEKAEAVASTIEAKAEAAAETVQKQASDATKAAAAAVEKAKPTYTPTEMFEAGKHYEVLPQQVRTITPGKIEITEVFAYSCGHCFNFESLINPWKKSLPDYAQLVKSPAVWNSSMEPHARMHFTALALNLGEEIATDAFNTIHVERNPLRAQADIAKLFAKHGVSEEKFNETYNSFSVSSQVNQATARARSMKITATPEMVVDGRFRISTRFEGVSSQADMLKVASFLAYQVHNKKL